MIKTEPPSHEPSLIDVQLAFAHWRKSRAVRSSTPVHLRKLAVSLLHTHRPGIMSQALDMNTTALKQWLAQGASNQSKDDNELAELIAFAALPTIADPPIDAEQCRLTINLPNGVQVHTQRTYSLA